ncbi:hypothetical protein WJX84_000311 [Apatococcus fuscideae]|uniref:Protein kinase domain-containing protein n=1 Tax=Apatococcus fuscideae TaxID=2026836 RepID=A0AAW1RHQ6_9CHLO
MTVATAFAHAVWPAGALQRLAWLYVLSGVYQRSPVAAQDNNCQYYPSGRFVGCAAPKPGFLGPEQRLGQQAEEDPQPSAKQQYMAAKLTNPFEVPISKTHPTDSTLSQSLSETTTSGVTSTNWTVDGQNHASANSNIAGFVGLQDMEVLASPLETYCISSGTAHLATRKHLQSQRLASSGVANGARSTTSDLMEHVDRELPLDLRGLWQISPKELQIAINSEGRPVVLGRGAFGTVYRGILRGMSAVAVKEVNSPNQHHQERFLREIALMRGCYDENIVAFRGAIVGESRTLLVMQYMENGNLYNLLATAQSDNDWSFRWYGRGAAMALDICKGVAFLHSKSIIHLDLKSPNVLLDEHKKAFVADIGLGKVLGGHDTKASAATWYWAAPEQIEGEPCGTAADVFAYGVILWEICSGESPESRYRRPLRVPEECPMHIKTLVESCCSRAPTERPTISQVFRVLTTQLDLSESDVYDDQIKGV